ncbi:hypothetical protein [Thiolinea disciformis]|uniref:hypothetical protein n=1 Tax=Thiolinea disciformis TaxID=125614 RepID=UPI000365C155|nr:hypothetical protein [Thiolinea disciformis]
MECRKACAACCIAPSISSPMPKHPQGKPAASACLHLIGDWRCELFTSPLRPKVCAALQPSLEMCGTDREQALDYLAWLECETLPM